jgi:hypothetical protein
VKGGAAKSRAAKSVEFARVMDAHGPRTVIAVRALRSTKLQLQIIRNKGKLASRQEQKQESKA